jgi:hypothetical protein
LVKAVVGSDIPGVWAITMKFLRTKIWNWWDIGLLKWCCALFGAIAGAYFHELVMPYVWILLTVAVILAVRAAFTYFRD